METLGDRIKRIRKQKNITQEKLEELTGTSQGHLGKIERNEVKNPSYRIVNEISKVLETSPTYLMTGEEASIQVFLSLFNYIKYYTQTSSITQDMISRLARTIDQAIAEDLREKNIDDDFF